MNAGNKHMTPSRRACRGFTLFEVLIAVSLLALLSLIVVSSLRFGVAAWSKGEATLSAVEEVSFAQGFLRRSLSAAYPRLAGEGEQAVEFTGRESEISLVGPSPISVSPASRAYLTIEVRKTPHGESLVAHIRPEFMSGETEAAAVSETLIDGMKSFRFSYLAEQDAQWRNEWINQPRLPALIRIEGEPMTDSANIWPVLIIKPQIDVDSSCRYDRLSKYCQGRR